MQHEEKGQVDYLPPETVKHEPLDIVRGSGSGSYLYYTYYYYTYYYH